MVKKNTKLWLPIITFAALLSLFGCRQPEYQTAQGGIYGTVYKVNYQSNDNLADTIRMEMERVNQSLSMFNKNSIVAKINRGESNEVDSLFVRLFLKAKEIYALTSGAFDITVAPLVNAWGFGYKHDSLPSPAKVDSLLTIVGMDKLTLSNGRLTKAVAGVEIDASSIAKGLGVDLVAEYLESRGIENYMIDIGGEIRVKGVNSQGNVWSIGIDKPIENMEMGSRELQGIVAIDQGALATSGNYRNFYVRDGKKYGHTIDPHTGYPIQREIVSASVYAHSCMEADAYATAFMVLGLKEGRRIVENDPHLEVYFIYNENDTLKTWMTEGFGKLLKTE